MQNDTKEKMNGVTKPISGDMQKNAVAMSNHHIEDDQSQEKYSKSWSLSPPPYENNNSSPSSEIVASTTATTTTTPSKSKMNRSKSVQLNEPNNAKDVEKNGSVDATTVNDNKNMKRQMSIISASGRRETAERHGIAPHHQTS